MNHSKVLLRVLPAFLVIIIAEELWGFKIGFVVAIVVGIIEFVFFRKKSK